MYDWINLILYKQKLLNSASYFPHSRWKSNGSLKILFKTGFAITFFFSSSLFLGGKRKEGKNNQLSYIKWFNRFAPHLHIILIYFMIIIIIIIYIDSFGFTSTMILCKQLKCWKLKSILLLLILTFIKGLIQILFVKVLI